MMAPGNPIEHPPTAPPDPIAPINALAATLFAVNPVRHYPGPAIGPAAPSAGGAPASTPEAAEKGGEIGSSPRISTLSLWQSLKSQSGRQDSNLRPSAPKALEIGVSRPLAATDFSPQKPLLSLAFEVPAPGRS